MEIPKKYAIGFQEGTCQLSCNKCAAFGKYATRKKEIGKMDISSAKKLIDEIVDIGVENSQIQPSIFTEPFANRDLKEIILYCKAKSIGLNIITNGILIDEEWEDFIISNMEENSIISFSLDAVTQSTYEKVRGKYSLEKIEKSICNILKKRTKRHPKITVSFSLEEDNKAEKELFIEKWKYVVDAVRINTCFDNSRKMPKQFKICEINEYTPCTRIFDVMTIDYNGDVRACQVDAFGDSYFGNVFKDGISNIWNGEKIVQLRKRHIQDSLLETDYCYGCEAREVIITQEKETDEFLIKEGPYLMYYNRK